MENQQVSEPEHDGHAHPQTGPEVTVSVDDATKKVRRGSYLVSEFKDEVGVDASLQLAEVIDGQLTGLDDGARIVIKGGEVFFTRVRKGSSS
jgi:hypothetical protein